MRQILNINFLGQRLKLEAKHTNAFTKFTGMMFKNKYNDNLLFNFSKDCMMPIHSLFVFFDFLAVWLDSENNVLDVKIVRPFRFSVRPKRKFKKLIEIPINEDNREIVGFLMKIRY